MSVFRAQMLPAPTSVHPPTTRIEPNPVSGDPARGLQAQVWDPLFLLGRQHQFGEFTGEDTGTPLAVEVTASFDPLVAWHSGPFDPDAEPEWRPLEPGALLEPLVEAERARAGADGSVFGARFDASAAWALQDALAGLGETAAVRALIAHCPAPSSVDEPSSAWEATARVLGGRGLDAAAVVSAFAGAAHPAWFTAALRAGAARRRRAVSAVDEWLAWMTESAGAPAVSAAPESWRGERLEYEFAVATAHDVLHAPAYGGGGIGWSSVDLAPRAAPGDGTAITLAVQRRLLASQLSFPGMPASRFWEFEDADIDLGAVWADPDELARVLVVEAAIVTGDDWLVLPVDSPPGGVLRVTRVEWRDTFGDRWRAPERATPVPVGHAAAPWRLFTTTEAARAGDLEWAGGRRGLLGWTPDRRRELSGLFVPPAMASTIEGPVVEDVRFLRDETTNLVWAIEQTAPADSGDPAPVLGDGPPALDPIDPGDAPADQVLGYALQTYVPGNWHPYVAQLGDEGVVLRRARLDRGADAAAPPRGELLNEDDQRIVLAGEVPRQGVRVQRVPRAARAADGRWSMWVGRRVTPGFGEGESGLEFDRTRRPDPPTR